jgi:hypothetical protein
MSNVVLDSRLRGAGLRPSIRFRLVLLRAPPPKQLIYAEDQQVSQHLQRIAHDTELAPCDLMPRDGHLDDGDARRLGEQQELDVEYPCREVLAREERAGGSAREQLEPALGIAQVADARDAQHGVQAVHEEVAQDGTLRSWASEPTGARASGRKGGGKGNTP